MSSFREMPFFSKYLGMILAVKTAALLGKTFDFYKAFGKRNFSKKAKQKAYGDYVPTERDVFAAVYSKSGTNLLMQTLQQIICKGKGEYEHIHQVVAWPESPFTSFAPLFQFTPPEVAHNQMRVIKTSGTLGSIPMNDQAKYVTVIRDPKAICVSSFHFMPGVFGLKHKTPLHKWVDLFCSDEFPIGSWASHTAGWWAARKDANKRVFLFDEMKADPRKCTLEMAELLGVPLTEAELEKVLHLASFAYMKANEDMFGPPIMPLINKKKVPMMIRKGKSNVSGELLSREQQVRIDQHCLAELNKLGSDFPYREVFTVIE